MYTCNISYYSNQSNSSDLKRLKSVRQSLLDGFQSFPLNLHQGPAEPSLFFFFSPSYRNKPRFQVFKVLSDFTLPKRERNWQQKLQVNLGQVK